jgi:hypothetical protein
MLSQNAKHEDSAQLARLLSGNLAIASGASHPVHE